MGRVHADSSSRSEARAAQIPGEPALSHRKEPFKLQRPPSSSTSPPSWLNVWKREYKALEDSVERIEARHRRSLSDLLTVLGLNFAFQGVLMSGVAPAETVVCKHLFPVSLLSAVASFGTFATTALKLRKIFHNLHLLEIERKKKELQRERRKDLVFEPSKFDENDISGKGLGDGRKTGLRFWVLSLVGVMLGLLLAFSVVLLLCIKAMLCSN